jgi:hypothetical protein
MEVVIGKDVGGFHHSMLMKMDKGRGVLPFLGRIIADFDLHAPTAQKTFLS